MIHVELLSAPSNSKGWARYALGCAAGPVVLSRTGNRWVSASHAGEAPDGAVLALEIQAMNRAGSGRTRREDRDATALTLIADPGAECSIDWRGSLTQGIRLRIRGARLAVAS